MCLGTCNTLIFNLCPNDENSIKEGDVAANYTCSNLLKSCSQEGA